MTRTVSIGAQDFEYLVSNDYFYIDKTNFIKEWWESGDIVTLITRPRRFGKTLNLSMLDRFWNVKYKGQGAVFQNLSIWKEDPYRQLQGSYPVIRLSFAGVKENNYENAKDQISQIITDLYSRHDFLLHAGILGEKDRDFFHRVGPDMRSSHAAMALNRLSEYLYRYYGKKVIILLDEYDTPMHEAYVNGFWDEIVSFTRNLFNNTFKTNPYMERAVMTGITRIGKESMFSDLNNLNVVTTTSDQYATFFGFTEKEVFSAMDEFGMTNKEEVKTWYDGFVIGEIQDIYNPWSIISFLDKKKLDTYWANTSSNSLVSTLLRQGSRRIKMQFEDLLSGRTIKTHINEDIAFSQLNGSDRAIWSLLLAAGYIKAVNIQNERYELALTNHEVEKMFRNMVTEWFDEEEADYNDFIFSLLHGDIKAMNAYINRISLSMFSSFDSGKKPSKSANPERFYHGFVLGLLVDLTDRYIITSNRESGYGRYDVMLEPTRQNDPGILLEFKVYDPEDEATLSDTVQAALRQIEEKRYEQTLLDHGINPEQIHKYGFAFMGKKVLIGQPEC